ncbi:hypothetical protein G8T75_12775 [Clostridium botulinum D/C]|uniref:hypothetical protein n=1 Tax=Clostridium botulinum TaxID=1491 RepID=UPI001E5C66CD|nr:hypothetical protein [Clostridium botulinum]MCD3240831.1 hypothetical protein [Clostridium botulinum D/C]
MEWSNAILNAQDIAKIVNSRNADDFYKVVEINKIQKILQQSITEQEQPHQAVG